jgi:outer membrane receptor protein involved in Fe transport
VDNYADHSLAVELDLSRLALLPLLRIGLAAAGILLLATGAVWAEEEDEAPPGYVPPPAEAADTLNVVTYQPEFYTATQPVTAFDMVRRTPGFTYVAGQEDVRGLAGALGNVLIDGQTQTSKSVTLEEVLQRIPASQVARIEVVRGGAGGIDMAGFAIVANVVRIAGGGSEVAVQLEPRVYSQNYPIDGEARVDWSRQANDLSLSGAIAAEAQQGDDGGVGRITRVGPTGALLSAGDFIASRKRREISANGALDYRSGDTLYRASFGFELSNQKRDEQARVATPERFLVDEDSDQGEFGFNVERKFSAGATVRLDVVQNYKRENSLSGRAGRLQASEASAGESNLRATLVLRRSSELGFEVGAEGAFNFLDQSSTLTSTNANVRVEELRIQPFATMNWQVAPQFALESGVRYETSTISQSGDTNSERSFEYVKPRLIAVLDVLNGTQLRFGYEYDVRQLDFQDFAASNGQSEGDNVSGNARLQPERAWVSSLAIERRLWGPIGHCTDVQA